MTTARDGLLDEPMTNQPPEQDAPEPARLERGEVEERVDRPLVLDEDRRRVTDPSEDMRAPDEQPDDRIVR